MSGDESESDLDSESGSGSSSESDAGSDAGDSGPGRREVAHRILAAEFDDATVSYSAGEGDRAPNYVVTPTGARVNRLFVAGVLTETESVNENTLRARIVDPSGAFVTYAGQYQPDERAFLDRAEPPAFAALTGKARTFRPEDSDRVLTSVRPESVNAVDADTRDRWVVTAARTTLDRLAVLRAAMASPLEGEALRAALADAGVRPAPADGIPRALTQYGTTPAYVEAIRRTATDALAVVAGRRDEVRAPDVAPAEGGDAAVGPLPATDADLGAALGGGAAAPDSTSGPASGLEPAADTGSGTDAAPGAESDPGPEVGTEAEAESGSEPEPEPEPDPDPEPESESGAGPEPEPTSLADSETGRDTGTAGSGEDDAVVGADAETDLGADLDAGIGDFGGTDDPGTSDEMYELDEEERRELEEEFGSGFATGNEVDGPGEAGIDVPDADDLEGEAPAETNGSAADGAVDVAPSGADAETEPDGEHGPGPGSGSGSGPDSDSGSASGSAGGDEPAGGAAGTAEDPASAGDDGGDVEADSEAEADVDLEDAVVTAMSDLDDGDGADREAVIAAVVDRTGAEPGAVEDAIQDALMGGLCYEPGEGTLKAI